MGNCGTKPKTSDDAPPPVEPQTPAAGPADGEPKEVPALEGTSQAVVAPRIEEATVTTVEEKEQQAEPKEKEVEVAKEDAGKEKETPTTTEEEAGELPASTPASVA